MNTRTRFFALALFLACVPYAAGQTAPPEGQKAYFTMSISLVHGTVKPGSEIPVTVEATNTSASPYDFIMARAGGSLYKVHLSDSEGKMVPLTCLGALIQKGNGIAPEEGKCPQRLLVGEAGGATMAPGKTAKDTVHLDEWFDLSKPGTYTIQFERLDWATHLTVKSNTVTLTVAN
jgi:hypothetical protein